MSDWIQTTLDDVADWSSGGTPQARNSSYYGGSTPWAVIGDLNDGLVNETKGSLTAAGLKHSSAKVVPGGTLLVAMYGSIGKLGIAGVPMATNQAIATARTKAGLDAKFLFYFLLSQRRALEAAGKGATQRNISQTILKAWPIRYPVSLDEQRRIVGILEDHLSRLDAAELAASSASRRLGALRERSIIDAITGAGTTPRSPGGLEAVGTHDGDLPSLPLGWDRARLGEVADVVGGVTKDAKKQDDPSFVEVPYLRVANVQRGHLKLDDVTRIRVAPAKAAALALQLGDVLLNEGGDRDKLARGWVWEGQIDDCIHQNHVFRARIHEPRLDPYFLSWTANTLGGPWAERNGKQSVNLASISLRMIRNMPVIVPPAGAASEIVRRLHDQVASLDRIEAAAQAGRRRSAVLRRSLLAAAFSGRLTGSAEDLSEVEEMMPA